ncbi:hypothetical protein M404DRAFT_27629 [Pisolithus tinctorius Marx 270]|uniref:Uncharacterized protein n=1 Tax=Pisolithus tinctorius Marx 270 TaxID=870435 RepID=A0A0C3NPB7_PISTI|nr:hypothetical protein M404DRAFT_27629 [Pisolithus tinctorius Marx 270]
MPEDTEGHPSRGAAHLTGEGSGNMSKGKGKQKATSEEDELADDVDNDEGNGKGELGPSAKGPHAAGGDEPCKTCAQANLVCIGEPESSCKQCQKAKRKAIPTPGPSTLPTLPFDKPQIEFKPFSMIATSLLNEPGDTKEPVWDDTPLGAEILEVEILCEWSTASFVEHLQVLEARAEDEEFELEQVYQLLEMLVRWVTYQIETVQARQEEL